MLYDLESFNLNSDTHRSHWKYFGKISQFCAVTSLLKLFLEPIWKNYVAFPRIRATSSNIAHCYQIPMITAYLITFCWLEIWLIFKILKKIQQIIPRVKIWSFYSMPAFGWTNKKLQNNTISQKSWLNNNEKMFHHTSAFINALHTLRTCQFIKCLFPF